MVYESGFTTRRTYSSRPVVSSYAVSYPSVHTRVYKTSYPIYSTYMSPRRIYSGTRVVTSPIRVVTSPTRIVSRVIHSPSPVRVVRTTTRVISSPERTTSYTYSTPSSYYSSSYLPTPNYYSTYIPRSYVYSTPSYVYSPISRIYTRSVSPISSSLYGSVPSYLKRIPPGYGARALSNYLNTEPYTTFKEETNRIRHRAQSLVRELHTPVVRRARSCTPFPVTGYAYHPTSQLALDAYVARITNPIRHVAKEVHNISYYPEPARKYVGKSHLASVRICGDKAYNIRRPMYDSDKVRTDINLMSWYLRHPCGKSEIKQNDNITVKEVDDLDPFRPSRRFSAPKSLDDPIGDETKEKQRLRQERLMTVNEEALDEIDLEKKKAQRMEEAKIRQEKALQEKKLEEKEKKLEAAREAEKSRLIEQARLAEDNKKAEEARRLEEDLRIQEEERQAEEARQLEEEQRILEEEREAEEARRLEEHLRILEEERKAEEARQLEEEQRILEEEREAEEARRLEEDLRIQEEERKAEEARRLEDEQRIREEELNRLAELEKQAQEDSESELARQAAELSEIARQEGEIVAQELKDLQQTERDEADVGPENISTVHEEAIVDEPQSPEQEAPFIEMSNIIDEVNNDNDGASESDAEEEEEEE